LKFFTTAEIHLIFPENNCMFLWAFYVQKTFSGKQKIVKFHVFFMPKAAVLAIKIALGH